MVRLVLAVLLSAAAIPVADAAAPIPPPGASSCSGCHANKSVDTPVPRLIGLSPAEIEAKMLAFRAGQKPASVMNRIAKGFSDAEIKAIAAWYGAQKN
jgi:cytochrome subunit of sulfide dehydrogenase